MKINKSVEQAIYVLLILALQKDGEALKSRVLSAHLQVSDSYLKKILMKLKNGGLIVASASKNGGYQLARPISTISIKDVFIALQLTEDRLELSHLARFIFPDEKHVEESEQEISQAFDQAFAAFYDQLDQFKLDRLLKEDAMGTIDWAE
ncbi:transcriptional regulator [Lactobacillus nasalidis]|uniref:Transcriptional regulator n=1 Tax=Lactobacillus nasalidis TaxID=2797258 RepID=A0ABQ3W4F8_9LACO|nr:Rrf2 family transcriptional regulator [Lactobacillus nasalidis]GHV97173.1 transcriptional regulator [Lactobacillus nasalidis]GHV98930.1 transcriptional regulator [Lactobacillus nasalidis]GHW00838.1 transcriptional regulator [Lactobacillus nasalidis]